MDRTRQVCLTSSAPTHVVLDANAYLPSGSQITVRTPTRLVDTRVGRGPIPAGGVLQVRVAGTAGAPKGTGMALVNVTATGARAGGYFTAYPCTGAAPQASVVNFTAAESRANAAWVRLDAAGTFCLRSAVQANAVVDLMGFAPVGTRGVQPIVPNRIVDSRFGLGVPGRVFAGSTVAFTVPGLTDAPQSYRGVLLLNVTVTEQTSPGYLTVWPCTNQMPTASSLNFVPGRSRANSVAVAAGGDGRICVRSAATTSLVVDFNGYVNPPDRSYSYAARTSAPPGLVQGMTSQEIGLITVTNAARAVGRTCGEYGYYPPAPALAPDARLGNSAQRHSDDMAARNFFSHTGSDGTHSGDRIRQAGYAWTRAGENLAAGRAEPSQVLAQLLASPSHCKTLMNPAYTSIGVGVAFNGSSKSHYYWTQDFGRG